jgi:hypothetical protein
MLDLALAVIDRLITLAKGRIEGRKEMFGQVIEPVFADLVLIHRDYIKMFDEVGTILAAAKANRNSIGFEYEEDSTPQLDDEQEQRAHVGSLITERMCIQKACEYLERNRCELEAIRERAKAMLFALRIKKIDLPPEETAFVQSVLVYFSADSDPWNWPSTRSTDLLSRLSELQESTSHYGGLACQYSEVALIQVRRAWSDLCACYAELRVTIAAAR